MDIQVYEIEPGRWGYRVDAVVQECHPDKDGFVPMSEEEAAENWKVVLNRMTSSGG